MQLTPHQLTKFWSKVNKRSDGIWEWTGYRLPFGHGRLTLGTLQYLAHRVSWELANGPVPKGMCVLHKNDMPYDVNPENLFLGTKADNNKDKAYKNRAFSGDRAKAGLKTRKLNEEQVFAIRFWLKEFPKPWRPTHAELATLFNVSTALISQIKTNKMWCRL